ncbi:MAG: UDP-N-acetylmuramate-L-alanine ligase, partial [Candidatus Amesbacteria bacterium GW2011_GWC1_47_15]
LKRKFKFPFADEYRGEIIKLAPNYSWFRVKGGKSDEEFVLKIPGRHNIANALGVWAGAAELGIKADSVRETFKRFSGVERRFSLTGEEKGIKVFDDYAVHPTAVGATMQAAKQAYPKRNIWVVFEPHQFSRLEIFMNGFASALKPVYKVIVTKPYAGREKDQGKVKPEDLVKKIGKKAKYISEFQEVANDIASKCKKGEIIIVSGAGKSYELSQLILNQIRSKK